MYFVVIRLFVIKALRTQGHLIISSTAVTAEEKSCYHEESWYLWVSSQRQFDAEKYHRQA